jgi:hypothetical protein
MKTLLPYSKGATIRRRRGRVGSVEELDRYLISDGCREEERFLETEPAGVFCFFEGFSEAAAFFSAAASRSLSAAISSTAARMAARFGDRVAGARRTRCLFMKGSLAPSPEPVKDSTFLVMAFGMGLGYRFRPSMSKPSRPSPSFRRDSLASASRRHP